jgi:hypothetical protein
MDMRLSAASPRLSHAVKPDLHRDPDRYRLISLFRRLETPLPYRLDSRHVDILVQRFDDVNILRLAPRTHNQSDKHRAGYPKPTVVIRLVHRRNLVRDAWWSNSRADIENLLIVNRAAQRSRKGTQRYRK